MLATIKAAGYDGFEIGIQRVDREKTAVFSQMVAAAGLETMGIHTHLRLNQPDWLANADSYMQQAVEFTAAVGAPYMPISGPRMDKTAAQLAQMADLLNSFGRHASAAGLRFCYHHHEWELANNWHELRFLMDNTDPTHVGLLSDIGWIVKAGESITAVIEAYADRIAYFHVKDAPADGWFTELGKGIVPLDEFASKLALVNPDWLVVERDEPLAHAAQSARESRDHLRNWFSI